MIGTGGSGGGAAGANAITVACIGNPTITWLLDWELMVRAEAIESGEPFSASLDGTAVLEEEYLDSMQLAIPGGVRQVNLVDINAAVHVRSGATGADVTLTAEPTEYECNIGGTACDPTNDLPSLPGLVGNTDCQPESDLNPCGRFIVLPTSTDCTPGGVCAGLGKAGPASQCDLNAFCVTGGLRLPLEEALGQYTADSQGDVLFGWDDQSTGASIQEGGPNDGTWILPLPAYTDPVGPIGLRVTVGGIPVALECTMGVDSKGPLGVDSLDYLSSPTPSSALISFPIRQ